MGGEAFKERGRGGTEVNVWHLPDPTTENSFRSIQSRNGMGLDWGREEKS